MLLKGIIGRVDLDYLLIKSNDLLLLVLSVLLQPGYEVLALKEPLLRGPQLLHDRLVLLLILLNDVRCEVIEKGGVQLVELRDRVLILLQAIKDGLQLVRKL